MKRNEPGMGVIVKTVTRLTVGLILIYGIYIVLRGRLGPGGGFAGGVIIALSFIHLMLAFGKEAVAARMRQSRGLFLVGLGAMVFLFTVFNTRYAMLAELAVALLVGAGLFMIFLALTLQAGEAEEK